MSAISLAADFIKAHEGCKLTAYQDSVGVWTIGYGHTGQEVRAGLVWTQAQADTALANDIVIAIDSIKRLLGVTLSDQQMVALASFVFNLGANALKTSTLLLRVNAEQWMDAAREFTKWDHAGGQELRGLLIRRLEEAALFLRGAK